MHAGRVHQRPGAIEIRQAGGIALGRFSLAAGNNEYVEIAQRLGEPLASFAGERHRGVVLGPRQRETTPKLAEQWLADLVLVQGVLAGQAARDLVVPDEGLRIVHLFIGGGQGEINHIRACTRELRTQSRKQ